MQGFVVGLVKALNCFIEALVGAQYPFPGTQETRILELIDRDNFNLHSILVHQAGQVTREERNTGHYKELQANGGQQGLETPPHKPGP